MNILVADPAKNITVFILDVIENPGERDAMVRAVMADSRIKAEQVGFVIPPEAAIGSDPDAALWRLEMAGGEFCGNAARSFGLYVAREKGLKGRSRFPVSVSGMDMPLQVEVDTEYSRAAVEMPRPVFIDTLDYCGRSLPVLVFEGITHIIAPALEPDRETFFSIKELFEKKFSGKHGFSFPALGVMFYDTDNLFMRPAVYVYSTGVLVFESSCGSGSAALGTWLSRGKQNGTVKYSISQPGGIIETEVTKKADKINLITIGGKAELGEPEQF